MKKIIIGILIIIEIGLIIINYNTTLSNKEIDKIETKEEEIKGNNALAIMIKGKNETEYKPSKSNTWPTGEYKYAGSLCIGNDGREIEEDEVISFDNASHTATITTKDTIYCYLYFAEGEDAVTRIERLSSSSLEAEGDVKARGDVLRRFQGDKDKVQNNYICFGTSITEECVNNTDRYMYRIIGYATDNDDETTGTKKGQLKLIKKEALEKGIQWWGSLDANIEWPESNIFTQLLGTEYLQNEYYIPVNWKEKISNHTWWYGDIRYGAKRTSEEYFEIENGKATTEYYEYTSDDSGSLSGTANSNSPGKLAGQLIHYNYVTNQMWTEKVNSKVGLMYLSDYDLSQEKSADCYISSSNYIECQNGWIHLSQNDSSTKSITKKDPPTGAERLMTRGGFEPGWGFDCVLTIYPTGYCGSWDYTAKLSIRPVIYTTENITLNGSGTINDPYIIIS